MGIYSVVVAIFIILAVTSFDLLRKKETKFDFLRLINIIFVLAYGVAPIYIYYFTDYFTLATIRHNDIMRVEFLWAILLAVLFYVIMVISYYFSRKLELLKRVVGFSEKLFKETNNKQFGKVAFILTLIGGACLLYYIRIVGGFTEFLRLGPILRDEGNYIQHPLMFIINIAPILCVASFIYYALFRSGKGLGKLVYGMWFLLSLIGAFLVVFHSSGRMQVFTFLMVFPLAVIVYRNKLRVRTIVFGSILFLVLVLYGDSLLNIEREVTINDSSFVETSANIVREFTFPLTNV
ncbi:O-antigen ligase, partial [Halalkalibacterium halodurans]